MSDMISDSQIVRESIRVFLDTGLQRHFVPLRKPEIFNAPTDAQCPPESLLTAISKVEKWENDSILPQATCEKLDSLFKISRERGCGLTELGNLYPWLRFRFGEKSWTLADGNICTLCGVWLFIETNTAEGEGRRGSSGVYDRGLFHQRNALSSEDKERACEDHALGKPLRRGESPFVDYADLKPLPLDFSTVVFVAFDKDGRRVVSDLDVNSGGLDLGGLRIELVFVEPSGETRDVDLVLDLGNTRTSALLFDHIKNQTFEPLSFKQNFKPLRIKPDPSSGEFESVDTVEAGIADSWFVLHELDYQCYRTLKDSKEPDLLLREWDVKVESVKTGSWPFRKTEERATGSVIERIPQMFMQISPVLIGDAAYRQFHRLYARNLVEVGAQIQQSSPKRFYWDDKKSNLDWSMLLNEWDKQYNDKPKEAAFLPTLQGDLCRFLDERTGKVPKRNLSDEIPAAERPDPYPAHPRYPRQATLTWFLLHLLERAMAQVNDSFRENLAFVPRRFRKVLITYPSGWTDKEVDTYRNCCQEALDIFSSVNVRGGVNSPMRLELVKRENSPDEAVAGQLPFLFAETIRYPGQTVGDWIATMGRRRGGTEGENTIRVMNFDIGGGTTDISILEYRDCGQPGTGINDLSAKLLFKDGQTLAGDDLLKRIIEKEILGPLVRNQDDPLAQRLSSLFSHASASQAQQSVRSRIVRTCLIPLATYCLSNTRPEHVSRQFSAQDAGISPANWKEFNTLLSKDGEENLIEIEQPRFSFDSADVAKLMEETFAPLFRSCALYAAAYEVDMIVFSGKTSEQPHMRKMARDILPLEEERLLFARSFRPGLWYPFTNADGFIADAKTVTVVGAALYYALSARFIENWTIQIEKPMADDIRNEWGVYSAMQNRGDILLEANEETFVAKLPPGTLLARRRNVISSPEPVFKICSRNENTLNRPITFTFERKLEDNGTDERLEIVSAVSEDGTDVTEEFFLKLQPCADGYSFWQETGIFDNVD